MLTKVYVKKDLEDKKVQLDIKYTLLSGRNVIFPTETVYGIGAYALSEAGVKGIYNVKGRPSDNPLIMHLSSTKDLLKYTKNHQPYVSKLIDAFWPGPLTMVFDKTDIVPYMITGGLDTIGIRIPSNDIALTILNIAGIPICAPSANISGRPSSTLVEHVIEDFNNKVDIIIDGGKSQVGIESTVLDVRNEIPVILRPGMITREMIKKVTNEVLISDHAKSDEIPKAPGMKYKHYAPKGKLTIVKGNQSAVVKYINQQLDYHKANGFKTGVICTNESKNLFNTNHVFSIGNESNEEEIASNLFVALREMDYQNIDYIYSLSFHNGYYSEAIMNRLLKAANQNVITIN